LIEHVVLKAGFIFCKCTIDSNAVGLSGNGTSTKGAVTALTIIQENLSESKPTSDYAKKVVRALNAWAERDAFALDSLGVNIQGTKFQTNTLHSMRSIKFGETRSYKELAAMDGRPLAYRAVASVCANNRIPIIIPCHRVIRSDGSLGDYFYGSDVKQRLLDFERNQQLL
jgi:O-6-methylguanine DNA methyltransferase